MSEIYQFAVSLLPVLLFLVALVFLDSFKLISFRNVLWALAIGVVAALVSLWLNERILWWLRPDFKIFSRYDAPLVEELAKCALIAFVIRTGRVGFLVDTAIYSFAVGAGFAVIENIYYLHAVASDNMLVWVVRGFGTAALHGATVVVFGVASKSLHDRHPGRGVWVFVPGFLMAVVMHSVFNHFILPPLVSTLVVLVVLPSIIVFTFARSESATREWLGEGWQADVDLLEAVTTGEIGETHVGFFLENLRSHFPPLVVGDMLALLQLHLELSLEAKGQLMAQEAGVTLPPDPELKSKLAEIQYLEQSIGKIGVLTLNPLLISSGRDIWQRQLLRA